MPTLESRLVIGATDETGGAFAKIQEHIAKLDKQIGTFDKLMAATRKVAGANDPMIVGIDRAAKSIQEEKVALDALQRAMSLGVGSAEEMASVQSRLARETSAATRAMSRQGDEAVASARKIKKERESKGGLVGMGGGLVGTLLGFEAAELGVKGIEAGATLDQALAKLRTTGVPAADIDQARAGYQDFAKTNVGMTEAEYLTKFGEARTMSSDPLKTTREMAQLSLALRGFDTTPDEVRSFVKSMDELNLPPAEQEKLLDRFAKVKQLYGANITGETYLAAQRRSSMAAYGWDEKFRENYFPFMLQSLGVTSGNDMMTAYSNYVGGHMQHSELKNLVKYGFVNPKDLLYNKTGDIKGLRPGAHVWEEDVMKANPAQFAWDMHQKFMSHKGATEDQFSSFVATLPRAMGAMIEFFTHGQGMAARDLALGKNPVGLAAAGNDYAANNPIAALNAFRTSIEQFGAALTAGPVQQAGKQLVALAQDITQAAAVVDKFETAHPGITKAGTGVAEVGATAVGVGMLLNGLKWMGRTALGGFGLGGLFGGGGGAGGAGIAAGAEAAASSTGFLAGLPPAAAAAAAAYAVRLAHPGVYQALKDGNPAFGALGGDLPYSPSAGAPLQLPGATPATPAGAMPYLPTFGRDVHSPQNGPLSYFPTKDVTVSGQAQVDHTVHLDVNVMLEPGLMAKINQIANSAVDFVVPLIGGGSGRMDSDAGPHRSSGGIGSR